MTNQYTSIILQIPKKQAHRTVVLNQLEKLSHTKDITANNPNLIFFDSGDQSVGIELVRKMTNEAALEIYSGSVRVMVLENIDTASIPAQNALLKLIEEPPLGTQIILTCENPTQLLPTILSRCLLITSSASPSPEMERDPSSAEQNMGGEVGLPATHSAAIDLAEKYKDRDSAIELVENLIISLQTENSKNPSKKTTRNLQILSQTLQYLRANVNVRLALEHGFFKIVK